MVTSNSYYYNLKATLNHKCLSRIGKIKVYKRFAKACTKLLSLPDNAKKELKFLLPLLK